jgi:hypothetical protein
VASGKTAVAHRGAAGGKRRAAACFTTQLHAEPEAGHEAVLPPHVLARLLRPYESASMSTAHFQQLYEQADDPWQVRQRWYEQRKRSLLLASLPAPRYRHI